MAAPDASAICIALDTGPGEFCVVLPGGLSFCATADVEWGDIPSVARSLMQQINTGLAPLGPIFTIFDVLVAVFDCINAIKDAFGPPPDVSKMATCISNLQQAINKLLELHPAVSIPKTIKSVLNVIILFLRGIRAEVAQLIAFLSDLAGSELRAAELGNFEMQAAIDCANDQISVELVNLNESIKPLSRLMGVIKLLFEVAGLPCVQIPLDPIPDDFTQDLLTPIDAAIEFITAVRDNIPALDFQLGPIPLSTDEC